MLEPGGAIPDDALIEQDANLTIAKQSSQRGLAVEKRTIPQILAIVLDEVEGVGDRGMRGRTAAQLLEPPQAGRPHNNRLPFHLETLGLYPPGRSPTGWNSLRPFNDVAGL